MSKTIEFIELEIKYSQLKIDKAKKEKIHQETMALLVPENKNINLAVVNDIEISFNEYKIKQLEQIKIELEAWEICKNNTMGNDYLYEITIYKSKKEDYDKFKKALEVGKIKWNN